MKPSSVQFLIAALFIACISFSFKAENVFKVEEIKPRFEAMQCIVKPRYTPTVEGYIKKYLAGNGRLGKIILSRASVYFPIFEEYLEKHDMPQDLKYLAVLESALNPKATSPVGAVGLWQFMAQTGKLFGLVIDREVDERSCAHSSTIAAMEYMARQYERYGSWELALAAYNCGAGNVNHAIKRARTNDYWELSRFLPRETRNFVPAFLGAAYLVNFYHLHEITPEYPSLDMQLTEAVMIFDEISLETVAAITHLPIEVVQELNPAYKKGFVPENPGGFHVVLPRRAAASLREYLDLLNPDAGNQGEMPELPPLIDSSEYTPDAYYFKSIYIVAQGDGLQNLANTFNCAPYNLRIWNNLTSNQLAKGQELEVWFPLEIHHFLQKDEKVEVITDGEPVQREARPTPKKIPSLEMNIRPIAEIKAATPPKEKKQTHAPKTANKERSKGFFFYQLHQNESLLDVAEQFPGVSVQNLLDWNGLSIEKPPVPGMDLKIKKS